MRGVDIEAAKADLRRRALAQRASATSMAGATAPQQAAANFFEHVAIRPGEVLAAYWPIRDEFDCRPILERLHRLGHAVCLPVTQGASPLTMRLWQPDTVLQPSGFGTLAPADDAPEAVPDIMVMPLLGFDAKGNRLGYGQGHYDRTLAALPKRPLLVGLAYAGQQLPAIPRAPHDVPLDMVVTEAGVIRFERS